MINNTEVSKVDGRRKVIFSNLLRKFDQFSIIAEAYGEKATRKHMEDEHLVCPSLKELYPIIPDVFDFSIFGIFDGHGGRQSVTFVKENFVYEIFARISMFLNTVASAEYDADNDEFKDVMNNFSCYSYVLPDKLVRQIVVQAFCKLDSRMATELSSCKDGCTANVVLLKDKIVYICNLGDSLSFLGRYKDTIMHAIPLCESHKPWMVKEKERVVRCGGSIENGRINGALAITRSFGDISFKRFGVLCIPTLLKFTINPELDEFIIMGCDGFWSNWTATDALNKTNDICTKEYRRMAMERSKIFNLRDICKSLVEFVIVEKKPQDNVSVLVIKIQPE